jgi:hypothetical protein
MPELRFLPNEAGEGEGLSDAGIETYRADPFPAVARETGQNSRDAHDKDRYPDRPVRIDIKKLIVPTESLPDVAKFREIVDCCLRTAQERRIQKEVEFFRQARRVLSEPQLGVLLVADFNTKGLTGPREEGSPFHSLVKSSGVSNKEDDTSGGSFGIGKSAAYSASDLQTVFYSTSYIDPSGNRMFACQGKTKFRSFRTNGGQQFRSVGYWGDPNGYMPVEDPALAPSWLRRDETGTTVCSIAVRETEDWQKEIIASVLMNFFSAIHAGNMEFNVDGDEINRHTLRRRFDDLAVQEAAKAKTEDFHFAREMYRCLTDTHETEEHLIDIPRAGTFRLRLLITDGLPKRVGILRNGMYVCDNLAQFGDKFARFAMYRDFVALVEPADDAGNVWLRRMENPRHDEFSPERILDPEQRKAARTAGTRLAQAIRETIRAAAKAKAERETDLDELSEFFALDTQGRKDPEGVRAVTTFKVSPTPRTSRVRRSKPPTAAGTGDEGGAGGDHGGGGGSGPGTGGGHGGGRGGSGTRATRRPFPLREPRTFLPDRADATRRKILFTPAASGQAVLRFESSGLNDAEPLTIQSGECRVTCVEGQRQEIEVRFLTPYDGPIEITSWDAEEAS